MEGKHQINGKATIMVGLLNGKATDQGRKSRTGINSNHQI
jgi:hypothetical protein